MNPEPLDRRWAAYRELTERMTLAPGSTERILGALPARARTRRFVREARGVALIVGLLGASSALVAAIDAASVEAALAVQIGVWAEE